VCDRFTHNVSAFTKILNNSVFGATYSNQKTGEKFQNKTIYTVPNNFDQTPGENLRSVEEDVLSQQDEDDPKNHLDTRVMDEDVMGIMKLIIKPQPNNAFAWDNWALADNYFSPPYCEIAAKHLGYDNINAFLYE
jgi:hypothetical protein